jgi:AcrR family transcriptional regulator
MEYYTEESSVSQILDQMATTPTDTDLALPRPKRADARRNYDALIAAAGEAFAEDGADATMEDIARRAGVGIGTLYRHFPTRPKLLEAVYMEEVDALCRSAHDFAELEPFEALVRWLERFVDYLATKRVLAGQLSSSMGGKPEVFKGAKRAMTAAGEPLLERAQAAGQVRPDARFDDVLQMTMGIAQIHAADRTSVDRILEIALDGLRYRPPNPSKSAEVESR